MSDVPPGGKRKYLSDVMIVRCGENNYYVCEKIRGRQVYPKLLRERSYTSTHYRSAEEAREAAEVLRGKIAGENPGCSLVEIDAREPSSAHIVRYILGQDGCPVCGLTAGGKRKLLFRAGEEEYRYIDKARYRAQLRARAAESRGSRAAYGRRRAYCFAENANLPALRYELCKVRELISSFGEDEELYAPDAEMYGGFAQGLEESILLQKQCVLRPGNIRVRVWDADGKLRPFEGSEPHIGTFSVSVFDTPEALAAELKEGEIGAVFLAKGQKKEECAEAFGGVLPENLLFLSGHSNGLRKALLGFFCLGEGEECYRIDESWLGGEYLPPCAVRAEEGEES